MAQPANAPNLTTPVSSLASTEDTSFLSDRTKKQLKIVLGGVYFVVISTLVTRRAVARRVKWAKPTYFRQNMHHPEQQFNHGFEAAEALAVATINVFSWGIFYTGGALYATDTSGFAELKEKLRVKGLSEEDREGAQQIVRGWMKAANPLNAFRKEEEDVATSETPEELPTVPSTGEEREG